MFHAVRSNATWVFLNIRHPPNGWFIQNDSKKDEKRGGYPDFKKAHISFSQIFFLKAFEKDSGALMPHNGAQGKTYPGLEILALLLGCDAKEVRCNCTTLHHGVGPSMFIVIHVGSMRNRTSLGSPAM